MTEKNPYASPNAPLVAEKMPQTDLIRGLKSQSTWRLLGLGIITYGVYYAHYCARQSRIINQRLDSAARIPSVLITTIFVVSYGSLALFIGYLLVDESHPVAIASNLADKLWMFLILVWGFYGRNRVNGLIGFSSNDTRGIHALWTLFFSPLYFNYKINTFNETPSAAQAVA